MKNKIPFHEKRIVYQSPGMNTIRVQRHLICKRPDKTELTLDRYLPADAPPAAGWPGVLLVHGGPLRPNTPLPQEWSAFISYGQLLAASGLLGFMFNHRYYGKKGEQQAEEDIEAALEYIFSHGEVLGLDTNRLCVWAFSGAGKFLPLILRQGDLISSLALYYTLLEVKGHETLWQNVFSRLPICVARAGLDRANINKNLDQWVSLARAAQATLELFDHPAGQHGFDILDDNARSREIIAQTIKFIQTYT